MIMDLNFVIDSDLIGITEVEQFVTETIRFL